MPIVPWWCGSMSDASVFFRIVRGPHRRRPRRSTVVVWHDRACVGVRADRLGSSRTNAGEAKNSAPYTYVRVERARVFIRVGGGVLWAHAHTCRPYEWSLPRIVPVVSFGARDNNRRRTRGWK